MKRIIFALSVLFAFSPFSVAEQKIVNIGLSAASVAYSTGAIRSVSLGGYSASPGGNTIAGMGFSYTVPTDKIAPLTAISFDGPHFGIGLVYISSGTKIFLSASDAVFVDGDNLGTVLAINYSVDSDTFSAYSGSFTIGSDGAHVLRYYSVDQAGNIEAIRTSTITVDNSSPVALVDITGLSYSSASVTYIPTASKVELKASDIVSGVKDLYYELNGSSYVIAGDSATLELAEGAHILGYGAMDNLGNASGLRTMAITVDATMPLSVFDVAGSSLVIDGKLYLIAGSSLVLSATDAFSGVKEIRYSLDGSTAAAAFPLSLLGEVGAHTLAFYSTDNVGNAEAEKSINFFVDVEMPITTVAVAGLAGSNGWFVSPTEVTLISTDTLAGVSAVYYSLDASSYTLYTSPFTVPSEGSHTVKYYARDGVGNTELEKSVSLNIDLSAPVVSVTATPGANMFGWSNTSVAVIFDGTDVVSGIAYCEPGKTVSVVGASQTVTGYCADYSGLSSTATYIVSIDTAAPQLSYSRTQANTDGWNNSDVIVGFECLDDLSGLASCPSPVMYSEEGINISTSVRAWDLAGNSQNLRVSGINIDKNNPISTATLSGTYRNGWYSLAVLAVLSSTDALSGVKRILYRLEGPSGTSEEKVYTGPLEFSSDGTFKLYYAAEDAAGNREIERAIEFNIDATAPLVKHTLSPVPNSKDWNNTAVQVVFSGTDTVSGIESCSSETVIVEGLTQKIAGWCRDLAGNIGYSTASVNIDRTAPVIGSSSPAAGQIFVATRGRIYLGFGVQDNLDTAPAFAAFLVQTEDRGSPCGIRPAVIAVTNGQSLEPLDIDDGVWRLAVSATDFADNTSTLSGGTFEVVHDVLAPRTGQTIAGGASLTDGVTTYLTGGTVLKFSSADDLVLAEDGIGLGVRKQTIRLKAAGSLVKELAFENPEPKQGAVFNSTFTLAAASGLADGLYSLAYYAEDILGNIEGEKTFILGLDNAAPVTAAEITGTSGENGWYISAVSVELTANDALSDVAGIYYQSEFNGQKSELRSYTGPFTLSAEGPYNVYFYAKDRLGNTEAEKTIAFKIDRTAPVSAYRIEGVIYKAGDGKTYLSPASRLSLSAADPVSGGAASGIDIVEYYIDSAPFLVYTSSFSLSEGIRTVYYRSRDKAGNLETAVSAEFQIDGTAPATSLNISGPLYTAEEARYVTPESVLWFTASDPLNNDTASGVLFTKYRLDGGAWQVYTGSFTVAAEGRHTLEYYSLDRVQNAETLRSVEIAVDNTPPVSRLTSGRPKYELAGYTLVSPATLLTLEAADPLSGGVASGLSGLYYSLGASPAVPYLTPFSLAGGGLNMVRWWSADNVQNAEPAHTAVYELDDEAPVLKLDCPGESFGGICNIYNSTFTVYGTVSDKYLKSWRLEYAPGADAQGGYLPVSSGSVSITTGAIGLLNPAGLAGAYTLRLSAADLVENAAVKQVNIRIGKPSVQLSLGGQKLLNKPEAVAVDGAGRLYIADTNNDRLALYTSTGGFVRYYGGGKEADDGRGKRTAAPRFNKPGAVALAGNNIYVSDTNNNRVVKLSTAGEVLLAIGGQVREDDDDDKDDDGKKSSGPADPLRLNKPRGLAVDAAGNLYVADSGNNRVLKLDPAGKELMRIILPVVTKDDHDDDDDEAAAAGPRGLALDGAGNIYITDPEGGRVLIYDALGGPLTEIKAFKKPHGIAVSPDAECLLIADAKTGGVYKLDRNKAVNLGFGAKAGGNDDDDGDEDDDGNERNDPLSPEFNKPGLLAFGADGSLYLADSNNNRVVKLGLPAAAPLVIDGRKGGKNRTSAALAVQGNPAAPLAGPDPSFRLGEVYVFPNPAKGTEAPVFHIETGIADSVKITIYTISGRSAHEHTLTGLPAELDDGNGLSYAYEYTWRGHIPSGVYLYSIEARKAGQKLKKTGKFGIVR